MPADKTGAPATVTAHAGSYDIAVEGKVVGHACIADRANQRVFYHTEVADEFEGRGLATILIEQALANTRVDGKRIIAVCPTVAKVLEKHPDFGDITDQVTPEIEQWVHDRAAD